MGGFGFFGGGFLVCIWEAGAAVMGQTWGEPNSGSPFSKIGT